MNSAPIVIKIQRQDRRKPKRLSVKLKASANTTRLAAMIESSRFVRSMGKEVGRIVARLGMTPRA